MTKQLSDDHLSGGEPSGGLACEDVIDMLPLFVGEELDPADDMPAGDGDGSIPDLESHLGDCASCRKEHDAYRSSHGALMGVAAQRARAAAAEGATADDIDCPIDLWPGVLEAIRELDAPGAARSSSETPVVPLDAPGHRAPKIGHLRTGGLIYLALCASFLMILGVGIAFRAGQASVGDLVPTGEGGRSLAGAVNDHGTPFGGNHDDGLVPPPGIVNAADLPALPHASLAGMAPVEIFNPARLLVPAAGDPAADSPGASGGAIQSSMYLHWELVPISSLTKLRF